MPIGVYSGLQITGASVKDVISNADDQTEAILAMNTRFQSDIWLTAMDLSVEAEMFGCQIRMIDNEIPTVVGRKVTKLEEIAILPEPSPGEGRTSIYLDTARNLVKQNTERKLILGGVIGPFSLAGRLFGVAEALELSLTDPQTLELLLQKVSTFLCKYVAEFKAIGVDGVIMAEPAAGLLSPKGLSSFSSSYVKQIIEKNQSDDFTIILHNCGAKIAHLPYILHSGAEVVHFGAPMDLSKAIEKMNSGIILAGNIDPSTIFQSGSQDDVISATNTLLATMKGFNNFIPSSGCDIPPGTPLQNLEAFYSTIREKQPI